MFRKHGNKPRNLCNAGFGDSMLLCTVKIMLWTIWIETILHAARLSKLWGVLHWPLWWLQQEHLLSLLASIAERRISAWYMLNTNYTNGTNVLEWRLWKIRAIRAIRVPSNCSVWYMLNTNYTNYTNVFEWRLRKIRAIRVIRVHHAWKIGRAEPLEIQMTFALRVIILKPQSDCLDSSK